MLDNDVFVIEHTLPPHNDVFTAPAVFFHYEGWGVFKSKETLAAQLRIAAVLLRKTGRSRPLFASSVGNNGDNVSGQVNPEFQVYSGVEEDYANALQPENYSYYDSGITDFSFYYPDNLYCDVTTVEDEDCEYGFLIKKINFIGSNGSELIYQLIQRTDSLSLEAETDYIYNKEVANLYGKEDIVFSTKDNYGKVIVTGWDSADKNYVIYNLCKIEDDYILQMKVIYPNYTDDLDTAQKGYVTECYYRLCGFSDSTLSVRSYEEYMNEN